MASVTPALESSLVTLQVDRLLQVCRKGSSDTMESVLGEGATQEDRTALANWKFKETGSTPLHIVCHYGYHQCIPVLLKHKADPRIWDQCGYTAVHCAVRGNHRHCVELLVKSEICSVNEPTEFGETPFLIACLSGSTDVASYLYVDCECGLPPLGSSGNTVLHYASASDSAQMLLWLLSYPEIKSFLDEPNKQGITALYLACYLGCINSLSALLHHDVNVASIPPSLQHASLSHSQVAGQLGNKMCYNIVENSTTPPALPALPTAFSFSKQVSQISDNLKQSHSSAILYPLRSNSSGSRGSHQSLHSTTSTLHQRHGSLVGTSRPVNLTFRRSSSLRRGSGESLKRKSRDEEKRAYLTGRDSATRLSRSMSKQSSRSLDQLLYDSTAYEPPPDILFVLPVERERLTGNTRKIFSSKHQLKLRVSREYWSGDNKSHGLNVCLCAAMHYSQTFPKGYTIVSPICFISCRSRGPCQVYLSLPHAVDISEDNTISRVVVLSTATAKIDSDSQSPFFSPSERVLTPLVGVRLEFDKGKVKFETNLHHPSLFAVAVREVPGSIPLPLRCCLYVLYPALEANISMVAGFDVEVYIGMNVSTVATAVMSWADENNLRFDESHFIMSGEQVTVTASLIPANQSDWGIECRGNGKFHYTQVSLTPHTDRDSYSHQLVYPQRQRFFIEPKNAQGSVKCRMSVLNTVQELCSLMVIPFSPKKETTPELSSLSDHRHSLPFSSSPSHRLPHDHRHSLPPSISPTNHTPEDFESPFPLSTAYTMPDHSAPPTAKSDHSTPPPSTTAGGIPHHSTPPPFAVDYRRSPLLLPMADGHHSESQV